LSALQPNIPQQRTGRAFHIALFCAALAWSVSSRLLAASSAEGIANRLNADWAASILSSIFFLFLLAVGFSLLDIIARRPASARAALGLPLRATAAREWLIGVAIGWGTVAITVLPMALVGDLHISFWLQPRAFVALALSLIGIALASLALEVIFRGYPFQRLIEAIGPVAATCGMALIFALSCVLEQRASGIAVLIAFLSAIVFSIAWFRTHALWLAWGMRFGWTASMGVIFGLPVAGSSEHSSVISSLALGARWFTGDEYGPEASWLMLIALAACIIVLIRVTRTYAWDYTHAPIVPGGFPMDVAPPEAHMAMEQAAQAKSGELIQILPSTPQGRSVHDSPQN
jgi:membrane protease YdiL (CAAX protease family)